MARKIEQRARNVKDGVSGNDGSGQGDGATGTGGEPGDGNGSGGGADGSVIQPQLGGNGDGDGTDNGNGGTGSGEPRRGRGRPAGSGTKKKAEISVTTLAEVIAFAHVALATVIKNDAWSLDDGESKKLADAASKVLRHYDTPAFSAQAMDWIGLAMVAGNIYGPRIMVTAARQSTPRPVTPVRQEPRDPSPAAGNGFIDVVDPMGSGKVFRMPANNQGSD